MEKEFVPYELAVKLKELGFDEPCLGVWNMPNGKYEVTLVYGGKLHEGYINDIQSFKVCAPLWQQAFAFILSKVDLEISSNYIYVICFDVEFYINKHIYMSFGNDSVSLVCRGNKESLEKLIELMTKKD